MGTKGQTILHKIKKTKDQIDRQEIRISISESCMLPRMTDSQKVAYMGRSIMGMLV